jgi:SAM-dependent methyltransferase
MIDLAPAALAIARRFFRQGEADCRLVQGDIAHLPFGEARFDVVWSAGVLEHFDTRGRKQVLGEMVRVCRPGGRVVTIVPYARALLDTLAKRRAERLGVWPWGYEEPLSTLREEYAEAGLRWVEESCLAMRQDLRFAEEFLTRRRWALWVLDELLYRVLRPLGRAGYLLGAIGVKEEEAGAWVPPEA